MPLPLEQHFLKMNSLMQSLGFVVDVLFCFLKIFLETGFLHSFGAIRFHLGILVIKYLAERNNLVEENLLSLTVLEGF